MGVRQGMLAVLANGPRYGYQLKTEFEAHTGAAWTLNVGQVYTTLQRLERDGCIVESGRTDDDNPIWAITDAGLAELTEWYTEPVPRAVKNRDDVSMKLLLALATRGTDPQAVIDVQRGSTMSALQRYTRMRTQPAGDDVAWQLLLDRLSLMAEAELKWLDRCEERIGKAISESPLSTTAVAAGATVPQPEVAT